MKEFAVEPIFGDEMGGKESKRRRKKKGKQTHQTPNVNFSIELVYRYLEDEDI